MVAQLFKTRKLARLEYLNIVQSSLRIAMLSNLLKLPLFERTSIIDKTLVVMMGIATNIIGITKHISKIKTEQFKCKTGVKEKINEFDHEMEIEKLHKTITYENFDETESKDSEV